MDGKCHEGLSVYFYKEVLVRNSIRNAGCWRVYNFDKFVYTDRQYRESATGSFSRILWHKKAAPKKCRDSRIIEIQQEWKKWEKNLEKIEEEIEHRKLVIRKEAIEAVKEARAQGDLSENFEYYAAKKHKNQNESRIRYLERMLKTATVVDDSSKSDEVGMDDIVEVEFEEDGEVEKYKLVTSIRGNSMENRVSIESPIGKALKGHRVGDRVLVKVNENVSYYLIIRSIDKTGDEDENIRSF